MDSILKANNVTVCYRIGDSQSIGVKEYILRKLTGKYQVREFTAVKNVSFSLERGSLLGIIGINGSGKSTLLKAISGIMTPTQGNVECHGKIAALLELGSGFDGDLTVRENTMLRGALLGYSREYISSVYQSIIDFAELEEFQNYPFRQLSSGMQARLAFSISSMVQPEILILDEVLSVGDGAFQKKSEAKMKGIINNGATTILVSHSTVQVRELCTSVLWLDKGEQVMYGDTQEVCMEYEKFLSARN